MNALTTGLRAVALAIAAVAAAWASDGTRPFADDDDARFWLRNMLLDHRFTPAEVGAATGLDPEAVPALAQRLGVNPGAAVAPARDGRVRLLPYPGGRHPRTGFLDGAIDPQRETKVSVFTPWDPSGYVVVDLPEAIWSHLGLTYLAHRHIDTIWDRQGVTLAPLEWRRHADGSLTHERALPNGIRFGAEAVPGTNEVRMRWWVHNGTAAPLTALRAQVCVMLARAPGMSLQTGTNKTLATPVAVVGDPERRRWILTGWNAVDRVWENPPVPCIHADPRLDDCPPGERREAVGWLWFREGGSLTNHLAELRARLAR